MKKNKNKNFSFENILQFIFFLTNYKYKYYLKFLFKFYFIAFFILKHFIIIRYNFPI